MTDLSTCKPCPECGKTQDQNWGIKFDSELVHGIRVVKDYQIVCTCGYSGPTGDTMEEAIERWNERRKK